MKYLKLFNNHSEYETFTGSTEFIKPNVSRCTQENEMHYTPIATKWIATYQNGHTASAECDSSGEIVQDEIYNKTYVVSVELGNCVTSIGNNAFNGCIGLRNLTIGNSVTSIGGSLFGLFGNQSLTSIEIPDGVVSIGGGAFGYCSSLTSATIGSGVTTIGGSAFESCSSLTSATIGSGVTTIGNNAFYNCTSLTSITVEAATPPQLEGGSWLTPAAHFDNTNNCPIFVTNVDAYKSASGWSKYADRIFPIE